MGADGLIVVGPGHDGADVSMGLRNADGSRAEMSGNGIRCLGQAVALDRGADHLDLVVATDAGHRALAVAPGPDARTASVRVDMGPAKVDLEPSIDALVGRAALVDVGNPHLVLEREDLGAVDVRGRRAPPGGPPAGWAQRRVVPPPARRRPRARRVGAGRGRHRGVRHGGVRGGRGRRRLVRPAAVTCGSTCPAASVDVGLGEALTLTGPAVLVATVEVPWP